MKVAFFGITANENMRGVERYTVEQLSSLLKLYDDLFVTLFCGSWQYKYYRKLLDSDRVNIRIVKIPNRKIFRHLFCAFVFPFYVIKYDLVHINNTLPILFKLGKKYAVTIHDLAEWFVPEKYSPIQIAYRKVIGFMSARRADKIITVSAYSKKTIQEVFHIKPEKIVVTYLGAEHCLEKIDLSINRPSGLPSKYILYWGVIEHSKGIIESIRAFNLIKDKDVKLIVCGKEGNAFSEFTRLIKNNDNIIYNGFVTDEELYSLIKNSLCVIFPSLYEGFGLPALEGFCLNDNIVCSSTTSLGEISARFAWQVDPKSINELALKIANAIKYPKYFTQDEKTSILKYFSWEKSSRILYHCYNDLIIDN
ncbi:glycosyltransferase family 4 protein [Celerinatantimonas sp. YJH-8]|uniref:glycosyltransferase family 4 protein n=1 Tax=Celerinatantimonas sp. YJH-8 TaxID=3228714 RepID=UPI0038C06ED8